MTKILYFIILFCWFSFFSCTNFDVKSTDRFPQQVIGDIGGLKSSLDKNIDITNDFRVLNCQMHFDIQSSGQTHQRVACLNPVGEDGQSGHCSDEANQLSFPLLDDVVGQKCLFESNVNVTKAFSTTNPYKRYRGAVVSLFVSGNNDVANLQIRVSQILSFPNQEGSGAQSTPLIGAELVYDEKYDPTQNITVELPMNFKYQKTHIKKVYLNCSPHVQGRNDLEMFSKGNFSLDQIKFNKNLVASSCRERAVKLDRAIKVMEQIKNSDM